MTNKISYCSGKSKATVTIFYPTENIRIISNNPPITVSLQPINAANQNSICPGIWTLKLGRSDADIISTINFAGYAGDSFSFEGRPSVLCKSRFDIDNQYYVINQRNEVVVAHICVNEVVPSFVNQFFEANFDNPNCKSNCTVKINDIANSLFARTSEQCPTYIVACDEECPEGYVKCRSINYPGYCCLPCEPIAAGIKGIKNTVTQLNKTEVSRG